MITFDSEPLTETVEAIGPVRVELWARADCDYFDLFARVCDVDGAGASWNVCDALARVTPERFDPTPTSLEGRVQSVADGSSIRRGTPYPAAGLLGRPPPLRPQPGYGEEPATARTLKAVTVELLHDRDHPSALFSRDRGPSRVSLAMATPTLTLHGLAPSHPCMPPRPRCATRVWPTSGLTSRPAARRSDAGDLRRRSRHGARPADRRRAGARITSDPGSARGDRAPAPLYPEPISDEVREAERWGTRSSRISVAACPGERSTSGLRRSAPLAGGPARRSRVRLRDRYIHSTWRYHKLTAARLHDDLTSLPEKLEHVDELVARGVIGGEARRRPTFRSARRSGSCSRSATSVHSWMAGPPSRWPATGSLTTKERCPPAPIPRDGSRRALRDRPGSRGCQRITCMSCKPLNAA